MHEYESLFDNDSQVRISFYTTMAAKVQVTLPSDFCFLLLKAFFRPCVHITECPFSMCFDVRILSVPSQYQPHFVFVHAYQASHMNTLDQPAPLEWPSNIFFQYCFAYYLPTTTTTTTTTTAGDEEKERKY